MSNAGPVAGEWLRARPDDLSAGGDGQGARALRADVEAEPDAGFALADGAVGTHAPSLACRPRHNGAEQAQLTTIPDWLPSMDAAALSVAVTAHVPAVLNVTWNT